MKWRVQFYGLIVLLVVTGIGVAIYKVRELAIPFLPGESIQRWLVEARVSFFATGRPVTASLALPDADPESGVRGDSSAALQYGFQRVPDGQGERLRGVWTARNKRGQQVVYYRVLVSNPEASRAPQPSTVVPRRPRSPIFEESENLAAREIIDEAFDKSSDVSSFLTQVLARLNAAPRPPEVELLFRRHDRVAPAMARCLLAIELCRMQGVAARVAHGVWLDDGRAPQEAVPLIEVWTGEAWRIFLPEQPERALPGNLFVWSRGGRPLLDLEGGENSRVVFTSAPEVVSAEDSGMISDTALLLTTVQSLPLIERAAFRFIVMIPIGAFVVVVLRNIVGVPTLGTFMPVLMALSFLQMRNLFAALLLFSFVIAVGLYFRFFLSRLNLLVVPRVAACVVIVTLLMVLTSVASYRLGYRAGMNITLFPMIILAWTIERMSLLWEEEGSWAALQQIGGSLVVAIIAFLVMDNRYIEYWAYYFPELLLLVLAAIILIGRYTGYRLSELRRFRHFHRPQTQ